MKNLSLLVFMLIAPIYGFDKVIIWGHKLHTHTHSYIHNAFYKAFKSLGYATYHFDDEDNTQHFDFSNSLFITEGQVDKNIPIRDDCKYIVHNCSSPKYSPLFKKGICIALQVYTDAILKNPFLTKVDDCIYYDLAGKCIYMPWATDLLPHEIDEIKTKIPYNRTKTVWWVGSIGGGKFGNDEQINPFKRACEENGISFKTEHHLSFQSNCTCIGRSYMAPTIVGTWQLQVGYIPCRIFKNIGYGQMGITNSKQVYELFQKKIVYNPDTYHLFYDAKKRIDSLSQQELFDLMDFVRDKHTYVNRIDTLLSFLKLVEKKYGGNI